MSRVGVVVLTYNRAAELARTLRHMLALPERPALVVVDNGSTGETAATLAREFADVNVVRLPANVGAAGRNAGVAHLQTPYVAFCDDDTWWAPGGLARAAALFDAHPRLAVVSGRVLVGAAAREDPTCAAMAASPLPPDPELPGTPLIGFMAGASVHRRAAFIEAGGFERRLFLGAEELLLALDLAARGWAMAYVADVVVHHHPSTQRDPRRRRGDILRNTLWCAWLRRPWPRAWRQTARLVARPPFDRVWARALFEAVAGLRWVLRERRVVPPRVETALRCLEQSRKRRALAPALLQGMTGRLRGEESRS